MDIETIESEDRSHELMALARLRRISIAALLTHNARSGRWIVLVCSHSCRFQAIPNLPIVPP